MDITVKNSGFLCQAFSFACVFFGVCADSIRAKWEAVTGVSVATFGIKKMKTRWGTCNIAARSIWLNLELAKKPAACLEFILVHEMVHFLERHHNDRFKELMDRFMPQWRLHREELNRAPLTHEDWRY
jgi:predicted metal-dependent hydrolase